VRLSTDDEALRSLSGRGVTVAVLDSGIHAAHPHIGGIDGGISLATVGAIDELTDRIGHGTAVAAAIREKSPHVRLLAVKIFDRRLTTSTEVLSRAIEWAADHGASIINLSVGTTNAAHVEALASAVAYATARGALIVSARAANGIDCWPGALREVVGVIADPDIDRQTCDVARGPDGAIVMRASPFPRPIPNVPPERNLSGVSFAVGNVSGILARLVEACGGDATAARRALAADGF
jgi:subtilisin family serine protease